MGSSIKDILDGNTFAEPEEIRIIKNYAHEHFREKVGVKISSTTITIRVRSAAFAGTLRMYLNDLRKACKTDKKLVIRIGQ